MLWAAAVHQRVDERTRDITTDENEEREKWKKCPSTTIQYEKSEKYGVELQRWRWCWEKNGRIKSRGETQTTHSTEASVGEKDWKRRADWATTQKCTAKKKEKKRSRKRKHKLFSYTIHILCFYLFCGFACAQRRRHAESLLFVTERFSLHLWCGQRSLSSS